MFHRLCIITVSFVDHNSNNYFTITNTHFAKCSNSKAYAAAIAFTFVGSASDNFAFVLIIVLHY